MALMTFFLSSTCVNSILSQFLIQLRLSSVVANLNLQIELMRWELMQVRNPGVMIIMQ